MVFSCKINGKTDLFDELPNANRYLIDVVLGVEKILREHNSKILKFNERLKQSVRVEPTRTFCFVHTNRLRFSKTPKNTIFGDFLLQAQLELS